MARRSVDFADRSGDFHAQCFGFGALGASFHQSGKLQESENSFQELESIQKEKQPGKPLFIFFSRFFVLRSAAEPGAGAGGVGAGGLCAGL